MRSREIAVRYRSVGAPTTFATHSYLTGTHGRYVRLEIRSGYQRVCRHRYIWRHNIWTGSEKKNVRMGTRSNVKMIVGGSEVVGYIVSILVRQRSQIHLQQNLSRISSYTTLRIPHNVYRMAETGWQDGFLIFCLCFCLPSLDLINTRY